MAEKRVKENWDAFPPEIKEAVGKMLKEKESTMTDLQYIAKQYAKDVLNNSDSETFIRQEMYYALAEAYEQGWVDCDTEGEHPETQDEFFNDGITSMPLYLFAAKYGLDVEEVYAKVKDKVIDKDGRIAETVPHIKIGLNLNTGEMEFHIDDICCKWYDLGCCAKGLPGTPCERKDCNAYYPK